MLKGSKTCPEKERGIVGILGKAIKERMNLGGGDAD